MNTPDQANSAQTVRVRIYENEDGEPSWLALDRQSSSYDDTWGPIELPSDVWEQFQSGNKAITEAVAAAVALSSRDAEGKTRHPCPEWSGYQTEARQWWSVVLEPDGTDETWPTRPVEMSPHFGTESEADELMLELLTLPDGVPVVSGYSTPTSVGRIAHDRLTIKEGGWPEGRPMDCDECGWSKEAHRNQQQTIEGAIDE